MNILVVCSTINFRDFTRRATIEAINKEGDNTDVLLFTSLKNLFKKKTKVRNITFSTYHFWIPDRLKKFIFLNNFEYKLRGWFWNKKISKYDLIFFTDTNQSWLLPYILKPKLVYLIRDPNILQNIRCKKNEIAILKRADLVLATSRNLEKEYLPKYYGFSHKNICYWPNTVDIDTWDYEKLSFLKSDKSTCIAGMAGNLNNRTDLELLDYITQEKKRIQFIIVGKNNLSTIDREKFESILKRENVSYLGFISFDILPREVIKWDIGLTIEKFCEYTKYTHHNKIYQYLALGMPVVTLKIHDDYKDFYPYIQSAVDYKEYSEAIDYAIEKGRNHNFKDECIKLAKLNSSKVRAKEFLSLIKTI